MMMNNTHESNKLEDFHPFHFNYRQKSSLTDQQLKDFITPIKNRNIKKFIPNKKKKKTTKKSSLMGKNPTNSNFDFD